MESMTVLLYPEMKLKADTKDEFLNLINSTKGFPITKLKPGSISAESGISKDESGQSTFHLWEKWEKMEDFENYMKDPNRDPECDFMQKWLSCMDGEPKMVFPEILDL